MSNNTQKDLLSVTAFFSLLLHAVIILGITFKLPDIASRPSTDNALDVVLINSSNNEASELAEIISSSNNAGGGEFDRDSESPQEWKPVTPSKIESVQKRADQQAQSSVAPDQLIIAKQGDINVRRLAPQETKLKTKTTSKGPDKFNLNALKLERERLLAKISQDQIDYGKRPKKEFLSPTTKQHGAAEYLDKWRKRLVEVGNANYPVKIKANRLDGTLIVSVEINRNGTINDIEILTPSSHKILNDSALRIIRDASPFDAFPDEEFFRKTDILVITRSIHFLKNNRVTSSSAERERG
ncbi:MAG: protein TonB [Arenicella sp.]